MAKVQRKSERRGNAWVVVADAYRADIYKRETRRGPLELVLSLIELGARGREQDYAADAPGRSFDSGGQGRHAMESSHAMKQHLREAFAQQIAAELEAGRQAGHFKKLIVIAAPAMLGELRRQFSDATAKMVTAEFSKDLTAQDPAAIVTLIDA